MSLVLPQVALTLVLASMRAPRSSNSLTMLLFPLFDATWRGVMSFCSGLGEQQMIQLENVGTLLYMNRTLHPKLFKTFLVSA